jgi:hypothetical protein
MLKLLVQVRQASIRVIIQHCFFARNAITCELTPAGDAVNEGGDALVGELFGSFNDLSENGTRA